MILAFTKFHFEMLIKCAGILFPKATAFTVRLAERVIGVPVNMVDCLVGSLPSSVYLISRSFLKVLKVKTAVFVKFPPVGVFLHASKFVHTMLTTKSIRKDEL